MAEAESVGEGCSVAVSRHAGEMKSKPPARPDTLQLAPDAFQRPPLADLKVVAVLELGGGGGGGATFGCNDEWKTPAGS